MLYVCIAITLNWLILHFVWRLPKIAFFLTDTRINHPHYFHCRWAVNKFLEEQKNSGLNHTNAIAVICNPEIDAIASAIAMAYIYKRLKILEDPKMSAYFHGMTEIIPVLIIERVNLKYRRDLSYYLESHGISVKNIVCRQVNARCTEASKGRTTYFCSRPYNFQSFKQNII